MGKYKEKIDYTPKIKFVYNKNINNTLVIHFLILLNQNILYILLETGNKNKDLILKNNLNPQL